MSVVVDTSILIDVLRGGSEARDLLRRERGNGPLHASEITRLEVLAGMRLKEEDRTRALFRAFVWHPLDEELTEIAGELGRRWLQSHSGIDSADLAIAATAVALNARLLTRNVRHFPMFEGLAAPY